MQKITHYIAFFIIVFPIITLTAQQDKKIKYEADDLYEFRKNGKKTRKLTGNVVFKQNNVLMYCDSSFFYVKENIMEAYGKVKIVDDSIIITAKKLIYNGENQQAKLRNQVIYKKGEQHLYTDFLDYNLETEIGEYFYHGKLQDSTNVLTSRTGVFYSKDHYALFLNDVELDAPDYFLKTDTLKYFTTNKTIITYGHTSIITSEETVVHANGGEFKTIKDQTNLIQGEIETENYYLEGDELFFDDIKKHYDAQGNVKLTAKNEDLIITGNYGFSNKANHISKIYGDALMKKILQTDTLYLSADTLVSIDSEYDSVKRILAYNNVKIWKYNLQGLADSAAYHIQDSLIYFYTDPIMWNKKNQMVGDTIFLEIREKRVQKMKLLQKSFITSKDTLDNYNQIKGRVMTAHFSENEITHIEVDGNGEVIYYALDEDNLDDIKTLGMNKVLCSNMVLRFKEQELNNISFYIKPEGKFIPPHELTEEIQKLRGFSWREEERPKLKDLIKYDLPSPKSKNITKNPKKKQENSKIHN